MILQDIPFFLRNKKVLVVMNGPDTSKLDINYVNKLVSKDELIVIILNGALSNLNIVDSKNVIYFINDPILYYFINNKVELPFTIDQINYLKKKWTLDNDFTTSIYENDVKSICLLQSDYKNVTLCVHSELTNSAIIGRTILKYNLTFFDKLLSKVSYTWGQDGREPSKLTNRYGLKFYPYESRVIKKIPKKLLLYWYKAVLAQTPNSFYKAMDIAKQLNAREILYIGRNSQISEWLDSEKIDDYIHAEYDHFYSQATQVSHIMSYEKVIREMYFSSQYINLLESVSSIECISLVDKTPYRDFFNKEVSSKYLNY
jgi:hypothetical protein